MSFHVTGIGETLWDLLPSGPQLGGAPANFACHAAGLGAKAAVITRIGNDDYGRAALESFRKTGINRNAAQIDERAPTGTVTVALSADGAPEFTIHENVAWDNLQAAPEALELLQCADAICFGTLAQRGSVSRAAVQELVAAAPPKSWRLFDVNLRQHYYSREVIEHGLRLANAVKLNTEELAALTFMLDLSGTTKGQIELLAARFGLQVVALTRGAAGSLLFQAGKWSECRGEPVEVVDTVGAGDAFSAALILGLLHKLSLDETHVLASEVARYVCTRAGATPPLPDRFAKRLAAA